MGPSKAEDFISARFHHDGPQAATDVDWSEPLRLTVTVRLKTSSGDYPFTKTVAASEDDARALQQRLGGLEHASQAAAGEFTLDLHTPQSESVHYSWASSDEPDALREVREGFATLSHVGYVKATAALAAGQERLESGHVDEAITILRWGIDRLGAFDVMPETIDDTDMKLISADHSLKQGRKAEAAVLYSRVLETRTGLYAQRYQP